MEVGRAREEEQAEGKCGGSVCGLECPQRHNTWKRIASAVGGKVASIKWPDQRFRRY